MIYAGIIKPLARSINESRSFQQGPPPNTRIFGPTTENTGLHQYPWLCSLRTRGYRGRHRCGVTLLSGPPDRTILVTAAHCNYICKNKYGETLEICCCRSDEEPGSCRQVMTSRVCLLQVPESMFLHAGKLQTKFLLQR